MFRQLTEIHFYQNTQRKFKVLGISFITRHWHVWGLYTILYIMLVQLIHKEILKYKYLIANLLIFMSYSYRIRYQLNIFSRIQLNVGVRLHACILYICACELMLQCRPCCYFIINIMGGSFLSL